MVRAKRGLVTLDGMRGCWGLLWVCVVGCGSSSSGGSVGDAAAGAAGGGSGGGAGTSAAGTGAISGSGGAVGGQAGSAGQGGAGTGGAGAGGTGGLNLGPDDLACEATGGAGNCVACCSTAHAAWESVAPVTRQCVCEGTQPCAAECPSYCAGSSDDPSCYACIFPQLTPAGDCYASARDSCDGELDCVQYVDCRANCIQVHGNTP